MATVIRLRSRLERPERSQMSPKSHWSVASRSFGKSADQLRGVGAGLSVIAMSSLSGLVAPTTGGARTGDEMGGALARSMRRRKASVALRVALDDAPLPVDALAVVTTIPPRAAKVAVYESLLAQEPPELRSLARRDLARQLGQHLRQFVRHFLAALGSGRSARGSHGPSPFVAQDRRSDRLSGGAVISESGP